LGDYSTRCQPSRFAEVQGHLYDLGRVDIERVDARWRGRTHGRCSCKRVALCGGRADRVSCPSVDTFPSRLQSLCGPGASFLAPRGPPVHVGINIPMTSVRLGVCESAVVHAGGDGVGEQKRPVLVPPRATLGLMAVVLGRVEVGRPLWRAFDVGGGSAWVVRVGRGDGKEAFVGRGVARAGDSVAVDGCSRVSRGPSRPEVHGGTGIGFCHFEALCRLRSEDESRFESQRCRR
jgi:hypothetical protein